MIARPANNYRFIILVLFNKFRSEKTNLFARRFLTLQHFPLLSLVEHSMAFTSQPSHTSPPSRNLFQILFTLKQPCESVVVSRGCKFY